MKSILIVFLSVLAGTAGARSVIVGCPTDSIGEFREVAEFAKSIGATHLDACQIEPSLWQWDQDRRDPYPNWSMYRPTIFKYVVPKALADYLPADYAARNLSVLKQRAEILKEFGFKSNFTGMEPAFLPERAYLEHPNWRGPRCDQARRARHEYYAPCTDDPEIRSLYLEAVEELCKACPFEYFNFRSNDSGAGFCWAQNLYPGANGPDRCLGGNMGRRVADFLEVIQQGAAKAGVRDAKVNVRAAFWSDDNLVLESLKRGQTVNSRRKDGANAVLPVGFPNRFNDCCGPIRAISRMAFIAEQLQKASATPDADIEIGLRDKDELDTKILLSRFLNGGIARGPVARWQAIRAVAVEIVGEALADDLTDAWELLEEGTKRIDSFETGGHLFTLGSLHQRWLIRPLVAFPSELTGEDRSYWRDYVFQAQTEEDADNLLDLQANRWLSGIGGKVLSSMALLKGAVPRIRRAAEKMAALRGKGRDEAANRYLEEQAAKFDFYVRMCVNAQHVIEFQSILDRTDRSKPPVDVSPAIGEQGDVRLDRLERLVRSEIDNTLEMIRILGSVRAPVVEMAADKAHETVMVYGPDLVDSLRRKIAVMEAHRRDFLRLYRSRNR